MILVVRKVSEKWVFHKFTQERSVIGVLLEAPKISDYCLHVGKFFEFLLSDEVVEALRPGRLAVEGRRWIS